MRRAARTRCKSLAVPSWRAGKASQRWAARPGQRRTRLAGTGRVNQFTKRRPRRCGSAVADSLWQRSAFATESFVGSIAVFRAFGGGYTAVVPALASPGVAVATRDPPLSQAAGGPRSPPQSCGSGRRQWRAYRPGLRWSSALSLLPSRPGSGPSRQFPGSPVTAPPPHDSCARPGCAH